MAPDVRLCPADGAGGPEGPADATLVAGGWVRRHLADRHRAGEAIELYESLGYEVQVREPAGAALEEACGRCASAGSCVLIYTRKRKGDDAVEATRCLRQEHQVILTVLECFQIALREAGEAGRVTREAFDPFVEFFRDFADTCHHGKEEDRLFPCLERKGMPREGGPIGVMLDEHRRARAHVRMIAEALEAADAGDPDATEAVLEQGREYVQLLCGHIDKEDNCLFGVADRLIQGADLASLGEAYRQTDGDPDCCAKLARCRALADRLAQQYGVQPHA